jgi:hypothetical protein
MSQRYWFLILLMASMLLTSPMACQKTYTLSPGAGPTATPTCDAPPSASSCASGIMWGYGQLVSQSGLSSSGYAELLLAVNCAPYSTAGVTVTGAGGVTIPLVYTNQSIALSGTTYSDYGTGGMVMWGYGQAYTLTSVTALGTAYATLVLPPPPNISVNGSTVNWAGPAQFTIIDVDNSVGNRVYTSSACWSATSPFSMPATAYSGPGTYTVNGNCINFTATITGGSGVLYAASSYSQSVTQ